MERFEKGTLCKTCLKPMKAVRTFRLFCNTKCRDINLGRYIEPDKLEKMCQYCFGTFFTTRKNQIYCSTECLKSSTKNKIQEKESEFNIFKRDKFRCIYCGKSSIEDGVKLHIEHISPLVLGGLTEINNLITSCQGCNNSKHANPLPNDIKVRILNIVIERNKHLPIQYYSTIEKQINELQTRHNGRVCRLVKR